MSVASSSRFIFNATLKRQLSKANPTRALTFASSASSTHSSTLFPQRIYGTARYATSAYAQAQPNAHSSSLNNNTSRPSSEHKSEEKPEVDPDEPPEKASFRERLRFLSRRYGWWALAVYLIASLADFSLVFGAIHLLGADHIRDLENRFRGHIGVGKRELHDEEAAAWPVPVGAGVTGKGGDDSEILHANNEQAARLAAKKVKGQEGVEATSDQAASLPSPRPSSSGGSGTLWTEAVLAYTIHKTLLLPFRVGVTAAITPSFVKYMVRLGWAKDNAAVHKASQKVKMARDAAKARAAATHKQP